MAATVGHLIWDVSLLEDIVVKEGEPLVIWLPDYFNPSEKEVVMDFIFKKGCQFHLSTQALNAEEKSEIVAQMKSLSKQHKKTIKKFMQAKGAYRELEEKAIMANWKEKILEERIRKLEAELQCQE